MSNDIHFTRGGRSGVALMAAAAVMLSPGISEYRPMHPMFKRKPKRARKEADRSRKQYLLKGIRP